jgi:photosystem II stability/assembly factor-like uncharacterized protein
MGRYLREIETTLRYPARRGEEGGYYLLSSMRFVDPHTGWAIGSGQIIRTVDGGRTWRNANTQTFLDQALSLYKAAPVNANTCWLLAHHGTQDARCFVTRDAGHSWSEKHRVSPCSLFSDIFFLNSERGWIVRGGEGEFEASLQLTEDSGRHWAEIPLTLRGQPRKLFFSDNRKGLLLETYEVRKGAKRTRMHRTEDGGRRWVVEIDFAGDATGFDVLDARTVFIVGTEGMLVRYDRPSSTLERVATGTKLAIVDLHFRGSFGLAVGTADMIHSRRSVVFLATTDFGRRWRRIKSSVRDAIFAVYLTRWDAGVLAATRGLYGFKLC